MTKPLGKQNETGALYRLHRPQTFAEVAGQGAVVEALRRAVAAGRPGHAYLFSGPRGTGKTSTARILAKALNCAHPKAGDADGSCEACQAIAVGRFLDLIEIDAASNRGIDEIRELRDKVAIAPTSGQRKVYLIDEVHMLTKEAFNALLKTLEEPPSFVTFVLATTEPAKVPATILSRCQRFDFRPATPQALAERLGQVAKAEKLKIEPAAVEVIARAARGSFRDALSMLDTLASGGTAITEVAARETLGLAGGAQLDTLEQALLTSDRAAALGAIDDAARQGLAADVLRLALVDRLRERLHATATQSADTTWQPADVVRILKLLLAAGEHAKDSPVPELPLEIAILEFLGDDVAVARPAEELSVSSPAEGRSPAKRPEASSKETQPTRSSAALSGDRPVAGPAPKNAQDLWEKLLTATKDHYSLSVCLQKTRPLGLKAGQLSLSVQSEFFMNKLEAKATRAAVETELKKLAGKDVSISLQLAAPSEDLVADALKTFDGAEVQ